MKNVIAIFTIAFLLSGLAIYQYMSNNDSSPKAVEAAADFKPKAGYQAAVFKLPNLEDETVAVGEGGGLALVNFWASWCGPCELEAPDLQKLHENYGKVMTLYGVNSTNYDKERDARKFVQDHGFTFPILMDREGTVTGLYKVNTFPTSFLIDADGVIRERINGVITYGEWERLINKWVKTGSENS
ncbi:TlpA family protein disulfide reductase [Paenibacillus sp. CAU 1782]